MNTVTKTEFVKVSKGVYQVKGTTVTVERDLNNRDWVYKINGVLTPFMYSSRAIAGDVGRKHFNTNNMRAVYSDVH